MGAQFGGDWQGRDFKRRPVSEINVTPMVDVMLVLLIIFMITAPMMTAGVTVDLPEAKSQPVAGQDEPISISVKNNGDIYLQESKITLEQIGPKLQAVAGENKEARIFVRGDRAIDYGTMMKVVGEIQAGGFLKVALISESPGSSPPKKKG